MSSRELVELVEGFPGDSWLKMIAHLDVDEAIGDVTVAVQDDVRERTLQLLRGERATVGSVIELTDGAGKSRRQRRRDT